MNLHWLEKTFLWAIKQRCTGCEPLDSPAFQRAASIQELQKEDYNVLIDWVEGQTGKFLARGQDPEPNGPARPHSVNKHFIIWPVFLYIHLCFRSRLAPEVVVHRAVQQNSKIRSQNVHFSFFCFLTIAETNFFLLFILTGIDSSTSTRAECIFRPKQFDAFGSQTGPFFLWFSKETVCWTTDHMMKSTDKPGVRSAMKRERCKVLSGRWFEG